MAAVTVRACASAGFEASHVGVELPRDEGYRRPIAAGCGGASRGPAPNSLSR